MNLYGKIVALVGTLRAAIESKADAWYLPDGQAWDPAVDGVSPNEATRKGAWQAYVGSRSASPTMTWNSTQARWRTSQSGFDGQGRAPLMALVETADELRLTWGPATATMSKPADFDTATSVIFPRASTSQAFGMTTPIALHRLKSSSSPAAGRVMYDVADAVSANNIRDGAVTSPKLANRAVLTDNICDGAVTSPKLANGAVTFGKLDQASPAGAVWELVWQSDPSVAVTFEGWVVMGGTGDNPTFMQFNVRISGHPGLYGLSATPEKHGSHIIARTYFSEGSFRLAMVFRRIVPRMNLGLARYADLLPLENSANKVGSFTSATLPMDEVRYPSMNCLREALLGKNDRLHLVDYSTNVPEHGDVDPIYPLEDMAVNVVGPAGVLVVPGRKTPAHRCMFVVEAANPASASVALRFFYGAWYGDGTEENPYDLGSPYGEVSFVGPAPDFGSCPVYLFIETAANTFAAVELGVAHARRDDLRYALPDASQVLAVSTDVSSGSTVSYSSVSLADRTMNRATVASGVAVDQLRCALPSPVAGRARDFVLNVSVPARNSADVPNAPSLVLPSAEGGAAVEYLCPDADGISVADGGSAGSETVFYFTEIAPRRFLVRADQLYHELS